ncbi:MAG: ECF-type sigma factor [Wenzhouxiangella sp.]|jgi:RNA polymerase sigma factor (TIGR02999 family)|nr:ECF-type sigma factor [Wenzhouxiangella sp.]
MAEQTAPPEDPLLTELLRRSADGDRAARDRVWAEVHHNLRALARSRLAREAPVTCQPTELVHEAFIKLSGPGVEPRDRNHFMALAAVAMRQVLVDQARSRNRQKRGNGARPLTLDTRAGSDSYATTGVIDVLDLHNAIDELAAADPRKAEAVVLSYFGGLTDDEVATALEISPATAKRDLRTARAWLGTVLASPR